MLSILTTLSAWPRLHDPLLRDGMSAWASHVPGRERATDVRSVAVAGS